MEEKRKENTGEDNRSSDLKLLDLIDLCGRFAHHPRMGRRGQERVLMLLSRHSMSQKELQEQLHIQSGSVSEIILKMQDNGYVSRKRDETDRRKIVLEITEEGRTALLEAQVNNEVAAKEMLSYMEPSDREVLFSLLSHLLEEWKNHGKEPAFPRKCRHGK